MEVKILVVLGFACLLLCSGGGCMRIFTGNGVREEDFAEGRQEDGGSEAELYDGSWRGPENSPTGTFENYKDELEREQLTESELDEETIRKAEQTADEDLLNGLNRILKNNETLTDILKAEYVYEFP